MKTNDPQMTQMSADLGEGQSTPNHLRKSASSADSFVSPAPHEIEVHIEELVLHGFDPHSRWTIGDALQSELQGLLSKKGLPAGWRMSAEKINAGIVPLTNLPNAGREIAAAIHRGGES